MEVEVLYNNRSAQQVSGRIDAIPCHNLSLLQVSRHVQEVVAPHIPMAMTIPYAMQNGCSTYCQSIAKVRDGRL